MDWLDRGWPDSTCVGIDVDEIAVKTKDQRGVKIARSTLSRIRIHRTRGNALASLGKGMLAGLRHGHEWPFSPAAPLGLVVVPDTLAWGAVAAPFCLLGDLQYKLAGSEEIKAL